MSITYEAVLPLQEDAAVFLTGLLDQERLLRGTRTGTRVLSTRAQPILVLRWFLDDTRMSQLARDNAISGSTAYKYRDEAITVLAARRPGLHGALLAAKVTGHTHVILDGTLIPTDRSCRPGPTAGVDLWWSGKHHHHGGNIQVLSALDGWPLWTSDVRPGREHDTTAARADPVLLQRITDWVKDGGLALADLGYQGEAHLLRLPAKKPTAGNSPRTGRPTTPSTAPYAASANEPTPCSRPPSESSPGFADAPGGSATSPQRRSSCSTSKTAGPHELQAATNGYAEGLTDEEWPGECRNG